ncbi:putative carboxylesterase 18 [Silene latifolia]|uniref:putative carboxylesterase 18 n=1 Tax=Silene latifolia TaxID=37657 RepID=UPI003D776080
MAANAQNTEQPPLQSLSLPFKTRIAVKFLSFITDYVRRDNGTVNRRLFNLLDRHIPAKPNPINGVSTHDITVDADKNLWFRLFIPHRPPPTPQSKLPVIVFFHGGGFVFLSAASGVYDAACRRFAGELNAVVCSVEYRLAPEHKLPTPYDDGADILTFLDKNRRKISCWPGNADVSQCFVAGDSAGGNISHHVVAKALSQRFHDLKVIGMINIQPFFGGSDSVISETALEGAPVVSAARTEWMWKAVLQAGEDKDHWAVNVCGPNGVDLTGSDFPETLLFIGGFDPLKDWQRRYYEWLRKCGVVVKLVEYNDAIHGFYLFNELPQARLLFAEVKEFIGKQITKVVN